MIVLATSTSKLEAFLGSAPASAIKWTTYFFDTPQIETSSDITQPNGRFAADSNGTSDVTICPVPGALSGSTGAQNVVRNIFGVKGYNPNASAVTATVQVNDGADDIQWTGSIPAGGSVYYFSSKLAGGSGWTVTGSAGVPIVNSGVTGPASSTDNGIARWNGTTGTVLRNSTTFSYDGTTMMLGGQTAPTGSPRAYVGDGGLSAVIGADDNATTLTNSTDKSLRLGMPHYTNSEEAIGVLLGVSASTTNAVLVGGSTSGGSSVNAATSVSLVTAANATTLTGTAQLVCNGVTGATTITGTAAITGVPTACSATATPAGGSTSARLLFGTTAGFGIYYGSGAPSVSAAQGSIYIRSDGSSTSTRLYVNTDGSTTWTNFTSAT